LAGAILPAVVIAASDSLQHSHAPRSVTAIPAVD